jgi:hypothetical protein
MADKVRQIRRRIQKLASPLARLARSRQRSAKSAG